MNEGRNRFVTYDPDRCVCTATARPSELAAVRAAVRSWLGARGIHDTVASDVLIAVGEACANVVEHAYRDGSPGDMEIDLARDRSGDLVVRVRDWGTWRADRPGDGSRDGLGRGTAMMRAVATEFVRTIGSDGTVVELRVPSAPPDAAGQDRR